MWELVYYATEEDAFALDHNKKRALRPYSVKCKNKDELEALAKILKQAGIKCVSRIEGMSAILVNTKLKTWATYPKPVTMTCKGNRTYTAQDFLEEVLNPVFFPDNEQRLPNHDPNKYYSNYEADAVIRQDENGQRYIKRIEQLEEIPVPKDSREAWGIPSYGILNMLRPITKEDYDGFGVTWDWSRTASGPDDIRHLEPSEHSVSTRKRGGRKAEPKPEKKPKPSKEEIEQYRQAVIDAFVEYGKQYPDIDISSEIEVMKRRSDDFVAEYMEYNTPKETAWMFIM